MAKVQIKTIPLAEPLETIGPNGRIGMVALATDLCTESDLRIMLPAGVELFTNRVANVNPITEENLCAMAPDIGRAAAGIVPGMPLDVLIYACTSGTVVIGEDKVFRKMREARGPFPCTTPITAVLAAMRTLSARRLAILTPYGESVNAWMAQFFIEQGFAVQEVGGFNLASDVDMARVSMESIYRAARTVWNNRADLLFISCTALRAASVVGRLEDTLGVPVLTSNQAMVWHAMELIGRPYVIEGYGSLFGQRLLSAT